MKRRFFLFLFLSFYCTATISAQPESDKKALKQLKSDIEYLASDALEGRRTATAGEAKAADYIQKRYEALKIPAYKNSYRQEFPFIYGKDTTGKNELTIDDNKLIIFEDYFPLPFSANTQKSLHTDVLPDMLEHGGIWLLPLYSDKTDAENAHFDYEKTIKEKTDNAKKQGAAAVMFFDNVGSKYPAEYNRLSETEPTTLPVIVLTYDAYNKYIKPHTEGVTVSLDVHIKKAEFTGTNVAAFIDNKAPYTVVIGAHYDHLGYGEDGGSTYRGKEKMVHNGADDNASGTAGLLQLADWIHKKKLRNYNYLFINFSGEELGLFGSKAIVKQMNMDSTSVAYMINMDMIGRLNDSTNALTLGGVGTSPAWEKVVEEGKKKYHLALDSSGVGPSDHTSFYHQGIPVLFFFTGIHHDYHKPSDDADKINYKGELGILKYAFGIVEWMDTRPKPKFTPTKQNSIGKVRFKVTLGIMPDYSYQEGDGIRVDGVSEDRPAIKAGIKAGDVITKLGENKVTGMQSYMEALGKFNTGDKTTATVKRGNKELILNVTF